MSEMELQFYERGRSKGVSIRWNGTIAWTSKRTEGIRCPGVDLAGRSTMNVNAGKRCSVQLDMKAMSL